MCHGSNCMAVVITRYGMVLFLSLSLSLCQIASQRVNSVDLSCCSLEELPAQLFYSQDLTHLNLKNNFMSPHKGVPALTRSVSHISSPAPPILRVRLSLCV